MFHHDFRCSQRCGSRTSRRSVGHSLLIPLLNVDAIVPSLTVTFMVEIASAFILVPDLAVGAKLADDIGVLGPRDASQQRSCSPFGTIGWSKYHAAPLCCFSQRLPGTLPNQDIQAPTRSSGLVSIREHAADQSYATNTRRRTQDTHPSAWGHSWCNPSERHCSAATAGDSKHRVSNTANPLAFIPTVKQPASVTHRRLRGQHPGRSCERTPHALLALDASVSP